MRASDLMLLVLLGVALWGDVRTRRIPNVLVVCAVVLGLCAALLAEGWPGVWVALGGALMGLALFLPFFALGWMGAGDVKLLAAAGSFTGAPQIALVALFAALFGGLWGAGMIARGGFASRGFRLPYAGALLAGAVCWMVVR